MKKSILLGGTIALFTLGGVLSVSSVFAEVVDITAEVTLVNPPQNVLVGDAGNLQGKIDRIQGLDVTGDIRYRSSDPTRLKITDQGEWQAISPGQVNIVPISSLSKNALDALSEKFPGAEFVTRDLQRVYPVKITQSGLAIYRVYNLNSGEHVYTLNRFERDFLKSLGWRDEGIGWDTPDHGIPVYRVYNPNSGEHFYTVNSHERDNLRREGWRDEGIGWQTENKGKSVYRLYNPNKDGKHHYTVNSNERDALKKLGWLDEGVSWYGE
ncbi:MAG: hypothetical protein LBS41_05175 [Streptococcaceae bacterium]|jgi:hypothetical protein|nr:hypothetical protein [Streptococcaceae bacterium]